MNEDMKKVEESKRALRRKLAALPVAQKLSMLDALRERQLAIRRSSPQPPSDSRAGVVHEPPGPYGKKTP